MSMMNQISNNNNNNNHKWYVDMSAHDRQLDYYMYRNIKAKNMYWWYGIEGACL